jgi:Arabinose-binding domain of AraC transcription regulator, N-term
MRSRKISTSPFWARAGRVSSLPGGCWYWNRFPGLQCDNDAYCYIPLLEETGYMPTKKFADGKEFFLRATSPAASHQGVMTALCVPLTGVARESMLSVRVLRGIAEAVEQAGVSRARLFGAARFDSGLLDSPEACVRRADVYRMCEVAIELTRDPALGLHWGERLSATTFNPISSLIAHYETLRARFRVIVQVPPTA